MADRSVRPDVEDPAGAPGQDSALDRRYQAFATRFSRAPGARTGLRIAIFVLGLVFVLGGFALVVLPGPLTIPPILVGVYIWSLEFGWARRLRVRVNRKAQEAWANAKRHPVRATAITVSGLVAAAVVIWAVAHYDLVTKVRDQLG